MDKEAVFREVQDVIRKVMVVAPKVYEVLPPEWCALRDNTEEVALKVVECDEPQALREGEGALMSIARHLAWHIRGVLRCVLGLPNPYPIEYELVAMGYYTGWLEARADIEARRRAEMHGSWVA